MTKLFFISCDANWQKYRLEVLGKLSEAYNVDVEILTTGHLKPYLNDTSRIRYKLFKSFVPGIVPKVSFFPGALRYIIKKKPDVVLCLNNMTQLTEYASLFLCKILRIRFVWWTHAYDHGLPNRRLFLKKLKEMFVIPFIKQADAIITFSEAGRQYLINKGIDSQIIYTAPNTLDTDKLIRQKAESLPNTTKDDILKELSLEADSRVILFSGRLNKDKNVDHAIRAVATVQKKIPNIKFVIIGSGSEAAYLKDLALSLVSSNTIFLGEVYDNELLSKYFTVAELAVMPGYVGLGIVHAFCFGLPFITEYADNHSPEIQYLHNGYNGYFVNKGDIMGLASRIHELLTDHEKRGIMAQNAMETAITEANINLMIRQMAIALGAKKQGCKN